jgi:hypothetical protein
LSSENNSIQNYIIDLKFQLKQEIQLAKQIHLSDQDQLVSDFEDKLVLKKRIHKDSSCSRFLDEFEDLPESSQPRKRNKVEDIIGQMNRISLETENAQKLN